MHDHKRTFDPLPPYHQPSTAETFSPGVEHWPISFNDHCNRCRRIESDPVRLRVPMVLFFIGIKGDESDGLMRKLDLSRPEFGAKPIQLLVVVKDTPSHVAIRLNITVPIIGDNGLAALLHAQPNCHSSNAAVIMGNDGRALGTVRTFPLMHPTLPIFGAIDRLSAEYPSLFCAVK